MKLSVRMDTLEQILRGCFQIYKEARNTSGIRIHSPGIISILTQQSPFPLMDSVLHSATLSREDEQLSNPEIQWPADRFFITLRDVDILKPYLEEFQSADTQTWKKILGMLMGELYALRPLDSMFDEKDAMQVRNPISPWCKIDWWTPQKARTWFYNHYARPHRTFFKFIHSWSACNVFYQENKGEIGQLTGEISGGVLGSQASLRALQNATTQLWKKLSAEEQQAYADLAKEWSEKKPPRHIQAKCVMLHAFWHYCADPSI